MMRILFAALVLLHALVTGPLLVQCMTADGHALTELLGHDPCHVQSGTPHGGLDSGAIADPCADLILGNAALIQSGLDVPTPAESGDGPVPHAICPPPAAGPDAVSPRWKPQRETALPRLEYSLRV